jgi:hypothetical protein
MEEKVLNAMARSRHVMYLLLLTHFLSRLFSLRPYRSYMLPILVEVCVINDVSSRQGILILAIRRMFVNKCILGSSY